jgi:hypothetical protein
MTKGIILFFIAALMTSTMSYAESAKILNTQNGHAYQLIESQKTWTEAGSHCDSLGGYLVTITSKGEENFISDKILRHSGKDIWAGATDKDVEGVWKWITNEPFDYTNWYTGEPNNENGIEDYLELKSFFGFKWNDVPNAVKRNWFICEWDKQPDTNRADSSPVVLSEKNTGISESTNREENITSGPAENPGEENFIFSGQTYTYYLPLFTYSNRYLTGVGISNSSASEQANLSITVFDNNGHTVLKDSMSIVPDGQETKVLYTESMQQGWSKIISDQPLTGVCFMIAAGAGSENYMADVAFLPKTYTDLHVPHVSSDKSWDTHLFIANPNDFEETVYIDVVASDGTLTVSSSKKFGALGSTDFSLSSLLQGKTLVGGKVKMFASSGFVAYALYTNIKTGARSFAGISPMEPFSRSDK